MEGLFECNNLNEMRGLNVFESPRHDHGNNKQFGLQSEYIA